MATYNTKTKHSPKTENASGHVAYKLPDAKTELTLAVASCMVGEPKFYGDTTPQVMELAREVCERDPEFVAKLAVYARRTLMLRSVSHMLACIVASSDAAQGTGLTRKCARGVVRRGDDVTAVLAAWRALEGEDKMFPNGMFKGLRDAVEVMGAYDLAKYRALGKAVSMRDALRVTHPAKGDHGAFGSIVDGTAKMPETWESRLSAEGNTKEAWDELLKNGKVPPMALARNLRNILDAGAELRPVYRMLEDAEAVRRSGMLPFRLYTAWREVKDMPEAGTRLMRAIDGALSELCACGEPLGGRTAVLVDASGSMTFNQLSAKSTVTVAEAAGVMASAIAGASDDCVCYLFDSYARKAALTTSVLANATNLARNMRGGWTDMNSAFAQLVADGVDVDRVIVISDMEANVGRETGQQMLAKYEAAVGHPVWLHAWDMAGYGTTQFCGAHVDHIGGFSDRVIEYLAKVEAGGDGMVKAVESLVLPERGASLKAEPTFSDEA